MSQLFSDTFKEVAVGAVPQHIKDMYDEIVDGMLSDFSSLYNEDDKGIVDTRIKEIKDLAVHEGKVLSTSMKTNYHLDLCDNALLKSIDKAIKNFKGGIPND